MSVLPFALTALLGFVEVGDVPRAPFKWPEFRAVVLGDSKPKRIRDRESQKRRR